MMAVHIKLLTILAISPLLLLLIHMVLRRILDKTTPQKVAVYSALLGYLLLMLLVMPTVLGPVERPASAAATLVYCILVYTGFACTYFHFFNMSETARRIRILHEINKAGSLSKDQILGLYNTSAIIKIRIKRLVETGQLRIDNGRYSIKGKTLYFAAKAVEFWRKTLNINREDL